MLLFSLSAVSPVGDLPFPNKTTRFSFQSSTNAFHKSALLHLPLQYSVVSIKEFSLWYLITSKSRSSSVQPLADKWLQDNKNIHSVFVSFQKPKKNCYCLQCLYLSTTAWRDSNKETLLSGCFSKIHHQ